MLCTSRYIFTGIILQLKRFPEPLTEGFIFLTKLSISTIRFANVKNWSFGCFYCPTQQTFQVPRYLAQSFEKLRRIVITCWTRCLVWWRLVRLTVLSGCAILNSPLYLSFHDKLRLHCSVKQQKTWPTFYHQFHVLKTSKPHIFSKNIFITHRRRSKENYKNYVDWILL